MKSAGSKGSSWFRHSSPVTKAWTVTVAGLGVVGLGLTGSSLLAETSAAHTAMPPSMPMAQAPTTMQSPSSGTGSMPMAASPTTMAPSSGTGSMPSGSMGAMAPSSGTGSMPSGSMGAMSGMGQGSTSSTAGLICPNVAGATVMGNDMEMAPVPSGPPTAAQQAAADQLVAQTTADIAKYQNLSVAEAAGYEPVTARKGSMTHYANYSLVGPNNVLNPAAPQSLMYANTVNGPVLVGAMYLGPGPCLPGPDIGGPLTDWHAHADLCTVNGVVVGNTQATGSCAAGNHNTETMFMLHVWTAPSLASQYQFQTDLPAGALNSIIQTGQA